MSENRFFFISSKGTLTTLNSVEEVFENHKNGGYFWLDYYQPTREELSTLIGPLGLHPLTVEDCTDENLVPKIEEYPNNSFIIFNAFTYADNILSTDEVDFIIGKNYLITVSGYFSDGRKPLKDIENDRQ